MVMSDVNALLISTTGVFSKLTCQDATKKALRQAHDAKRDSADSQRDKIAIVEHRFNLLNNLGNIVNQGDTKSIQLAIRAIFPEGVSFDGNQCRTPRLDEVLRYSLLLDSDCEGVFAGEQGKLLKKSLWVDPAGQKPNTINPDLVK